MTVRMATHIVLRLGGWVATLLVLAGGLVLWNDHGIAIAMAEGAWMCAIP